MDYTTTYMNRKEFVGSLIGLFGIPFFTSDTIVFVDYDKNNELTVFAKKYIDSLGGFPTSGIFIVSDLGLSETHPSYIIRVSFYENAEYGKKKDNVKFYCWQCNNERINIISDEMQNKQILEDLKWILKKLLKDVNNKNSANAYINITNIYGGELDSTNV